MPEEKQSQLSQKPFKIGGNTGGRRPGAGRKKGVRNKRTAEMIAEARTNGKMPVDFMLEVMRSEIPKELKDRLEQVNSSADVTLELMATLTKWSDTRMEAAKSVAPYLHPRLANLEVSGNKNKPLYVRKVTRAIVDPVKR